MHVHVMSYIVHVHVHVYLAMFGLNTVGGVPCCLPVRLLLKLPPRFRLMKGCKNIQCNPPQTGINTDFFMACPNYNYGGQEACSSEKNLHLRLLLVASKTTSTNIFLQIINYDTCSHMTTSQNPNMHTPKPT